MNYRTFRPGGRLGDFVDYFWRLSDAPEHRQERILPSGTQELVINLQEDEFRIYDGKRPQCARRHSGAIVSGAYRGSFVIDGEQHASVIGVHFKPGGAGPFLGTPVGELADLHVGLETLWGRSARELRERLCAATTAVQAFGLLESALLSRLGKRHSRHETTPVALAALECVGPAAPVRQVARRVGLSERRFIQVFSADVGMTPKQFGRVRRFQRVLAQIRHGATPDWARLAVACGYYDQSHLIHDFREFSGLCPTDYLHQRSDRVKEFHVPVAGE